MTKLYPPGQYSAMMSRAARKSPGATSAKRKAALARVTKDNKDAVEIEPQGARAGAQDS